MKRFYCTRCQKIKRVRVLPSHIENVDASDPELRVSECRHHNPNFSPQQITPRTRVRQRGRHKKQIKKYNARSR
jgi:hypothetical protein